MKKQKPDPVAQYERFKEVARQIGADETSSAADALMGRLARTPPDHKPKPRGKAKAKKPAK
ncbi:hypothetical protein [Mesorhizobium sp.]|uniref:hypothetical protein n=1 Tax=Mesorhizobium sp. TaxID=1871066 RepID=UPI000FE76AA3|nr:hypothetical protein [Mesorhizobium sp.]RWK66853.1 MAG: hypothetical protein EOR54_21920 [Mesorhizobium sp.]